MPSALVTVSSLRAVPVFVAVTATPGMAAPWASVMLPTMAPYSAWADAVAGVRSKAATATSTAVRSAKRMR